MASSKVILTGPLEAWPNAAGVARMQLTTVQAATPAQILQKLRVVRLDFKVRLRFRQRVAIAGKPNVERGQNENTHDQVRDQTSDDYDCERPLRIGPDGVGERRRQ